MTRKMESYKYQKLFSIQDILKILPHRFPFILIDKVKIIDLGRNLVATKNAVSYTHLTLPTTPYV